MASQNSLGEQADGDQNEHEQQGAHAARQYESARPRPSLAPQPVRQWMRLPGLLAQICGEMISATWVIPNVRLIKRIGHCSGISLTIATQPLNVA
jgi:hypothetical protein